MLQEPRRNFLRSREFGRNQNTKFSARKEFFSERSRSWISISQKHTCLRRVSRMTNASRDCVDEKMIFFNANRDVFIASCILQVFLLDFLTYLAQVADDHESFVFALERRRSALPAWLSSASSLANAMQTVFQVIWQSSWGLKYIWHFNCQQRLQRTWRSKERWHRFVYAESQPRWSRQIRPKLDINAKLILKRQFE